MSLSAKHIRFRYAKGPIVLDDIACTIKPKEITAIVGPNGGGKSTLIRLLAGLRPPESGEVSLNNQPLSTLSPKAKAKQIAFIEQRPSLAFDFSVRQVIEFGGYWRSNPRASIEDALERFELTQIASKPYAHLSVGQQQRVSVARVWVQISQNPTGFLLADEPCSAMDPKHTLQTMAAFKELASTGIGVAVVIHDLSIAARWADSAIVLDQTGKLAIQDQASQALSESVLSGVFDVEIRRHELADGQAILIPHAD